VVGFSGGWLRASGGGLLASFREYLTIDDRGYDTHLFRFVGGFSVTPRADLVFDLAPSKSRTMGEYRELEWESGLPITHSTEILQIPISAGVRYWVVPRGRRIGRLAWVPNTLAFHVGGGGGTRWYKLRQRGDFVDFVDLLIYRDTPQSQGWALSGHVSAGASIRTTRRLFVVAELRQVWSRTALAGSYFGDIGLSGLQMTGGVEFVF
jgi:hypothetical protein